MAKKVLIIGSKANEVVCRSIAQVLGLIEAESKIATHDEALAEFLANDYDLVIISDYDEHLNKEQGGFASYRDITASATGQKIVRCGYDRYNYSDYISLPCQTLELFKLLGEKQK